MAKGTLVVSLRSKGLASINKHTLLDFKYQALAFATEFFDIFIAFIITITSLSWSAWISISVAIVTTAATMETNYAEAPLEELFPFFMYIILPLIVLFVVTMRRRDKALSHLATVKSQVVSICLSLPMTESSPPAVEVLKSSIVTLIDDLHQYLQHKRPYARHFFLPYRTTDVAPTDTLVAVSRELGVLLRKVHRSIRSLHLAVNALRESAHVTQPVNNTSFTSAVGPTTGAAGAGAGAGSASGSHTGGGASDGPCGSAVGCVSEADVRTLRLQVTQLHAAVEELINIKEARTPVLLRSTIRWFCVALMPSTLGPYWNYVSKFMRNKALSGIVGVLTQVALMAIVDCVVGMEDPFDDVTLDNISLFETLDHLQSMMAPPAAGEEGGVESYMQMPPGLAVATGYDPRALGQETVIDSQAPAMSQQMTQQQQQQQQGPASVSGGAAGGSVANGQLSQQQPGAFAPGALVGGVNGNAASNSGQLPPTMLASERAAAPMVSVYVPPPMPLPPMPGNAGAVL